MPMIEKDDEEDDLKNFGPSSIFFLTKKEAGNETPPLNSSVYLECFTGLGCLFDGPEI